MNNEVQTYVFDGSDVRTVTIDSEPWFIGKDVAKVLGYVNPAVAVSKNVPNKYKKVASVETAGGKQHMTVINSKGVRQLVSSSRMPNAIEVAKSLGIETYSVLNCVKEQETIDCIVHAFKGEEMVRQYVCGSYRIDLYFPKHELAVECDEFGHKDRKPEYEVNRQSYIEKELGCQFVRFNPDEETFNIFDVINRIYKKL